MTKIKGKKLRIGLPNGSLNDPERWSTLDMLLEAGYDVKGYSKATKSSKEIEFLNDPEIEAFIVRPQTAPLELYLGMMDAAIFGMDWAVECGYKEERLGFDIEGVGRCLDKITPLGYGNVRVCLIKGKCSGGPFFIDNKIYNRTCFTEYENVARAFFKDKDSENIHPIVVYRSAGVTEDFLNKGSSYVIDCVQSGRTLERVGAEIVQTLFESEACLFSGPSASKDSWKQEKVLELRDKLLSVVRGRSYDYVIFNIVNDRVEEMRGYMRQEQLFADEPTFNQGERYSQFAIMVPKKNWPRISRGLQCEGATNIIRLEPRQIV